MVKVTIEYESDGDEVETTHEGFHTLRRVETNVGDSTRVEVWYTEPPADEHEDAEWYAYSNGTVTEVIA